MCVSMNVCIHLQGKDKFMYETKIPLSNISPSERPTSDMYFLHL